MRNSRSFAVYAAQDDGTAYSLLFKNEQPVRYTEAHVPTWICRTEAESEEAGRVIARELGPDAVVHLVGDLGAGKTFLARAMASELGADPGEVASPSFAIVHEYPREGAPPIIHIDGYRLSESRREWLEIGIPEMLSGPGVKLIEWPKREFAEFEEEHVDVEIRVLEDGAREITTKALTHSARAGSREESDRRDPLR